MQSNQLFWLINTAGWFIFLLCTGLFFTYFSGNLTTHALLIQLFAFCYYVPASGLLRYGIKQLGWFESKQHGKLIPVLLLATFFLALFGQFLVSLFMLYALNIMTWDSYSVPMLLMSTGQNWIVLCLWVVLYLMIKQIRNSRQQQLKHIQLESTLRATELQALKAQLNPHFIFNCLNNMRALAIDDGHTTRQMITHLSEILKYSFQYGDQTHVTVAREIQHVKNYLALENIQFEDRLTYNIDVEPSIAQHNIPSLSIQLLVENAIKHGIMGLPQGGHIQIRVQAQDAQLIISVANSGELTEHKKHSTQSGVGLVNLKQRLQLFYAELAHFELKAKGKGQVLAQITLPLEAQP